MFSLLSAEIDLNLTLSNILKHSDLYHLAKGIRYLALQRCNRTVSILNFKSRNDAVTDLDFDLQGLIFKELRASEPQIMCVSEEFIEVSDKEVLCWMVDPLDGTSNYIQGLPMTAISVAMVEGTKVHMSFVINLINGDVYSAKAGEGVWLNGSPIRPRSSAIQLIGGSTGFIRENGFNFEGWNLRIFGSQAMHLCYVAQGSLAGCVSNEAKAWDDAAGSLLVTEAGGAYYHDYPNEGWLSLASRGASLNSKASKVSHQEEIEDVMRRL